VSAVLFRFVRAHPAHALPVFWSLCLHLSARLAPQIHKLLQACRRAGRQARGTATKGTFEWDSYAIWRTWLCRESWRHRLIVRERQQGQGLCYNVRILFFLIRRELLATKLVFSQVKTSAYGWPRIGGTTLFNLLVCINRDSYTRSLHHCT
jgi:hypothetical protein